MLSKPPDNGYDEDKALEFSSRSYDEARTIITRPNWEDNMVTITTNSVTMTTVCKANHTEFSGRISYTGLDGIDGVIRYQVDLRAYGVNRY